MDELTLYLLLSSVDNLCKQFGSSSGSLKCPSSSRSRQFDTLILFLKEFFEKVDFEKKSAEDREKKQNYPVGKELDLIYAG